jgi:ATP-dependent helicase YprA (DUF1998 family)
MPAGAGFHLERPATYVLARPGENNLQTALFVGDSDNLAETWAQHRRSGMLDEAWALGAEAVHVHLVSWTAAQRRHVVEDLVRWHRPALNLRMLAASEGRAARQTRRAG